jgi:hypothetical protein
MLSSSLTGSSGGSPDSGSWCGSSFKDCAFLILLSLLDFFLRFHKQKLFTGITESGLLESRLADRQHFMFLGGGLVGLHHMLGSGPSQREVSFLIGSSQGAGSSVGSSLISSSPKVDSSKKHSLSRLSLLIMAEILPLYHLSNLPMFLFARVSRPCSPYNLAAQ